MLTQLPLQKHHISQNLQMIEEIHRRKWQLITMPLIIFELGDGLKI